MERGSSAGSRGGLYATGTLALILLLAAAWFFRGQLAYMDENFHQLIVANLLGVGIGALLAVEGDRLLLSSRREGQSTEALEALEQAVHQNEQEVDSVISSLTKAPQAPIFSSLDPKSLSTILPRVLETSGNAMLVRRVSEFRAEIEKLDQMLNAQLEIFLEPEYQDAIGVGAQTTSGKNLRTQRQRILSKIQGYGQRLSKRATKLRSEINEANP